MASTHTLTGNVFDLAGVPLVGASNIGVRVVTNLGPAEALVDKTTNRIHLGGKPATVDLSGNFTVTLIDTSATDLNVVANTLEYQVEATYTDKAAPGLNGRKTWLSGWFPLTTNANLADIATDVSPMAVQSASGFALESKGYRDAAQAARDQAQALVISDLGTTDGQTKALIQAPASQTAQALSATIEAGIETEADAPAGVIAKRGGKTKTDGQNVKNLRRPTLAVDKWWPNGLSDHQVVWADETLKIAYSVGQDNRLRKSTWTQAGDEGILWGNSKSSAAAGTLWCAYGVFLRIPTTGELLMDARAAGVTTLVRSTDDGVTWSTVWTSPGAGKMFLGPQSVVRDENTGHLYLVEYTTDVAATTVDIWRSTDKGANWAVWKSYPRSEATAAGVLRHWHSARYDSVSQRVYFLAGDQQADGGIYRVNSGGTDIELVVKNSALTAFAPAAARAVDIMFFPTYIAWPCDGSGSGQNHVYRMNRSQIGAGSPVVERVAAIDNTGWWTVKASDDGTMWVFSTSSETPTPATADPGVVHLYAVSDNGATVDEIAAVAMDGNAVGFASLSPLGGGSGQGTAFWLRAHTYQQYPNITMSAFQLRSRMAFGVVPIVKPPLGGRAIYRPQGRNCGPVTLAAGQSVAFARTRVPKRATKLSIVDFGAMAMNPLYNACKVEIWNITTAAKLAEYAGMSWVYDGNEDTGHRWSWFQCAAGDEVEFRVTNTHASTTIQGSAFVEFGWSFT